MSKGLKRTEKGPGGSTRSDLVGLRQIKAVLRVAIVGSVSRAAHLLGRSQAAISKSLSQIEDNLGGKLFDRHSDGLEINPMGKAALRRFRLIEGLFAAAAEDYQRFHKRPAAVTSIPLFTMDIAVKRLRQVAALNDAPTIDSAAAHLGVSIATIYKSLHEIESHLDTPLFARLPDGRFVAIGYGCSLLPRIKLALGEIENVIEDLAALQGEMTGRVAIGCLPSMASWVVPSATIALLGENPHTRVRTHEAPYHELVELLRSGEVDLIVGGLDPAAELEGLRLERLFYDRVCIIARAGHPLAARTDLTPSDFQGIRWVMPLWRNTSSPVFEALLVRAGIQFDNPHIEYASVATLNGLLMASDCLTVGTLLQSARDCEIGQLAVLPFRLPDDAWPSGIVLREATEPSVGARLFIEHFRRVIQSIPQKRTELIRAIQTAPSEASLARHPRR